jgi:hypothetical protein
MPRKSRKKGGNPLRLTLCQDFLRSGRSPYSAATEFCCNKNSYCKKKNKKTSKVRMRSASQREGQMKKMEKYSRDRKMKPGEKLGDYGSHCVNAAGRRWGHTKPRWNNREGDPEEGIADQSLRNWHPSAESLTQPPPDFHPGIKIERNPLVCRRDGWTGAEGGYTGEWCLLDPVGGLGSLTKTNLDSSTKQLCRTRWAKNWIWDNELTLAAAKKAGYFFDRHEKAQAIEDARKKRIMTEGVKLRAELRAEEKRRKAAEKAAIAAEVQRRAANFAEENTFVDAKENDDDDDDDDFVDAQSAGRRRGGRRRTRRRRKNRRKRGGRRKSRRGRRRKMRQRSRKKRGGTTCPPPRIDEQAHFVKKDCPVRGYQACCAPWDKCKIVAGGKGARATCVPTNVIDLT